MFRRCAEVVAGVERCPRSAVVEQVPLQGPMDAFVDRFPVVDRGAHVIERGRLELQSVESVDDCVGDDRMDRSFLRWVRHVAQIYKPKASTSVNVSAWNFVELVCW